MLTDLLRRGPRWIAALLAAAMLLPSLPASAQQAGANPSGLPLPRFATTRSEPINVRVGPGTRYEVAWIYLRPGLPVEIIQEFDTWRKIRDVDGAEGWVHQNLLSGARAGYVAPWDEDARIPLRSGRSAEAAPRALLSSRFRIGIEECDGQWCAVSAVHQREGERPATYSGYISQGDIWGVYQSETFD